MLEVAGHGLRESQRQSRNWYEFFFLVVLVAVAAFDLPEVTTDSPRYIAMAEGRLQDVIAPFSDRILAPFLSASIHSTFGLSIAAAFSAVSLVGAALFGVGIHFVYRQYRIEPYAVFPAMLAVPWVIDAIRDAYLPDILVMGLTCVFLLCVRNGNWLLAGLVAVLSILARETSLILVFVAIGFAARQRRWLFAATLAAVSLGAVVAVKHMTQSAPNFHAMNGLLYMVLKIPVNFLRNVIGIQFWLNDMPWCDHPLVTVPVGQAASAYLGKITAFGVCAPNFMAPITNAALLLSIFGVLPGTTLALALRNRGNLGKDPWLLFVMLYGAIMLALGTCTGASVYRLLTYGWPLFIFGTPILWKANLDGEPFDRRSLMAAHLGLSWLGPILGSAVGNPQWWQDNAVAGVLALLGILLNTWAYRLVKAKRHVIAA
ncbi:MAG: hypothetical protein ACLQJR_18215 [Stellaceae bacterium]